MLATVDGAPAFEDLAIGLGEFQGCAFQPCDDRVVAVVVFAGEPGPDGRNPTCVARCCARHSDEAAEVAHTWCDDPLAVRVEDWPEARAMLFGDELEGGIVQRRYA